MPSDMQEKTPGVYVRADNNELPHELDMLWSNSRPLHREDRSPLIAFVVGLLLGVVATSAVFMLFIMHPQVKLNGTEVTAPVSEDLNAGSHGASSSAQTNTANPSTTASSSTSSPSASASSGTSTGAGTAYTVVSGDNLGRIAEKVYGSSSPELMDKIQRANNMSSPDKLQINQKLIIPPKNY